LKKKGREKGSVRKRNLPLISPIREREERVKRTDRRRKKKKRKEVPHSSIHLYVTRRGRGRRER